jgi:hypothetical protein
MVGETHIEVTLIELSHAWESLLDLEGISSESGYRIRRLIDRAQPLADKMFLKTVKGREMILQCWEKTRVLRGQLESRGERLYSALTELERLYEELLKRAYEFRIKAG